MSHGGRPPSLPPDVRDLLAKEDWAGISRRLAGYAAYRLRNVRFRTGLSDDVAKGWQADDIAAEAIYRVLSGQRKWNPKVPLEKFLRRVVYGLVRHLRSSMDNQLLTRHPHGDGAEELHDRAEHQAALHDLHGILPWQPDSPERGVIGPEDGSPADRLERLIAALKRSGDREAADEAEKMWGSGETRARYSSDGSEAGRMHTYNVMKRIRRAARRLERR